MDLLPTLEAAEKQLAERAAGAKNLEPLFQYRAAAVALSPENLEAWQAFNDLSMSRPLGMAAGGIPQSEILAWFILRGRNIDRYLVAKLTALDRLFMAHQAEKAEKGRNG